MIAMDNFERWQQILFTDKATAVLNSNEKADLDKLSLEKRNDLLRDLLEKPVGDVGVLHPLYFRNKWADALLATGLQAPVSVFEIAPGSNDVIPLTVSRIFNHPQTSYTAANTNKQLTQYLYEKTSHLPIKIKVIEEQAQMMGVYAQPSQFDAVLFEHAVNDIMYDMIARKNGLDTIHEDWFGILPKIISCMNSEYANGTYESTIKEELLGVFSSCLDTLKEGSYIIINHFMYQADLDLGLNYELWETLLPTVRKWVEEAKIGKEVFFDGFEPQWWMFIQKA